eukprot:7756813-Pyramimonas_sp.AAC.1
MVGYLLGLGDRHPSNLMLDRYSGKVLHIDFGDCFEASVRPPPYYEYTSRSLWTLRDVVVLTRVDAAARKGTSLLVTLESLSLGHCGHSAASLTCSLVQAGTPVHSAREATSPSLALDAPGEVSREGALPADAHADKGDGGERHRGQLPLHLHQRDARAARQQGLRHGHAGS